MVRRGKWKGSKECWLFVIMVRRKEEGRRLRDRLFWKKEKLQKSGRETEKAIKRDAEVDGYCKKVSTSPFLPPGPLQYFYTAGAGGIP
jgi:hypothetical protein